MRRIILVLDNIRSCYNVGAILRTAEGMGIKEVILSGYTPKVHDKNLLPHLREKQDKEIRKTALGAEDMLRIDAPEDIKQALEELKENGWQIVGLENNISDQRLKQLNAPDLELNDKIVLVLGEEVNGINYSLHDIFDLFLEIPMHGQKESFNVSVAAGIALYGIISL